MEAIEQTIRNPANMKRPSPLLNSKLIHVSIGIAMASVWGWFAYRHVLAFQNTHQWAYLLFCASETLMAAFFIFRTQPETISSDPLDWLFAIAGTLAPLFFSPAAWGILPLAESALVVGVILQILGLVSLNRSFALVAAKREIKTAGMYCFVRHPLYASYLLINTGYVLTNTTSMNLVLYVMTIGFLYVRMVREEKHLAVDASYGEYMREVRYRVIPFVF